MSGYKDFTEYDFLRDDAFIEWMLAPTPESDEFWKGVAERDPYLAPVMANARTKFRNSVRLSDYRESDEVIDRYFAALSARIMKKKQSAVRRRRLISGIAGAACAVIFALVFIFQTDKKDTYILSVSDITNINAQISGEVTLLSETKAVTIDNNSEIILRDLLSAIANEGGATPDGAANAANAAGKSGTVSTIQLIVPHERQSSVRLDDGSVVWVNAGSRVSFPEKFGTSSRDVTVDGEVYLSVTKDPSRPFTVNVGDLKVRVLGTEFGITAYSGEKRRSVVLVSGSVEVCRAGSDPVRLRPNQCMEIEDNWYGVGTVDVMEHVGWKNGWLHANGTRLGDLASKLSRYYSRRIECDPAVANLTCSGKLLFSDDIVVILDVVSKNTGVKYTITENRIILYP